MLKSKKLVAMILVVVMVLSVGFVSAFAEENLSMNKTPLEIVKIVQEAVINRDIETFFDNCYTEGYSNIEQLQKLWDNEDDFTTEYQILNEKFKNDDLAVYFCLIRTEKGNAYEVTTFVKKIGERWKVYCGADIVDSPYYEFNMLFEIGKARSGEPIYTRKTAEKSYYSQIDGELKEVSKDEFAKIAQDSQNTINSNHNSIISSSKNVVLPRAFSKICNWSFSDKPYNSSYDTYTFNYSAGSSPPKVTLNLKQWATNGSTINVNVQYKLLKGSTGNISYYGESSVNGYYPDNGDVSAARIIFNMQYTAVNSLFLRIIPMSSPNVSGYGEGYNY